MTRMKFYVVLCLLLLVCCSSKTTSDSLRLENEAGAAGQTDLFNDDPTTLKFVGQRIDGLNSANNLTAEGITAPTIHVGQTLTALFWWAPGTTPSYIAQLWSALDLIHLKGWSFQFSNATNSFRFVVLDGKTQQIIECGQPVLGLNAVAITRLANNVIHSSMNGGSVVATALTIIPSDPGIDAIHSIGGAYPGFHGWDVGGILELDGLNKNATDAELQNWSNTPSPAQPANRFAFPSSLTTDPTLTFDWSASRDLKSSVNSEGLSLTTFVVNGFPTLIVMQEQYITALGKAFADSYPAKAEASPIGSGNFWHANPYGRLKFKLPKSQPQMAVAYVNNDPSTTAKKWEKIQYFRNGKWAADLPPVSNNTGIELFWIQPFAWNAAPTDVDIELWQPPTEDITVTGKPGLGGFIAGVVTSTFSEFDTSKPEKRIVWTGDSVSCGLLANTEGSEAVAQLRSAFLDGGVTLEAHGGDRLFDNVGGVGFPNVVAFANKIVALAQDSATPSKIWLSWYGFNDQHDNLWTIDQFQEAYQALIDQVSIIDPEIKIFIFDLPQQLSGVYAYNTAIKALTRCTVVATIPWQLTYVDKIHPDVASQIKIMQGIKRAIGLN
jgi:hypothetical protein